MPTSSPGRFAIDLPAGRLATCDRLADQHAGLRERGVHHRDGGWVIARPPDVTAALASPALTVAAVDPRGDPPAGDARRLQARMARFCDFPQHAHRRELVEELLPDVPGLQAAAAQRTAADLRDRTGVFDVMPLARTVPVAVLAAALGVPAAKLTPVAILVGRFCDALAPSLSPLSADPGDGDEAACELMAALAAVGPWDDEQVAAAAGLLFQARDATAALIGAALLAEQAPVDRDAAASIEWALRHDAPVQCTRRTAVVDVQLGGVTVPRGAPVWVVVAAAEEGPPSQPATFGAGPHACPAAAHAVAVACGVLTVLRTDAWQLVPGQPVGYEPRPNLRLPAAVRVQRP